MANNLATLNGYLDDMLDDGTDAVWTSTEKDNLINRAVARLWPNAPRPVDPTGVTVTLVSGTYYYPLGSTVLRVVRVDYIDSGSNEGGALAGHTWEVVGDATTGDAKLHVAPSIVEMGGTLRVLGYGRYDTTTNLIPDEYVPFVLSFARAEAYRQLTAQRMKFKNWASRNQVQNISMNEMLQMIRMAEADAEKEADAIHLIRRPRS